MMMRYSEPWKARIWYLVAYNTRRVIYANIGDTMPENVKEVDIKIDEKEKEVEVEKNPLEKLQEETNAEPDK